MRNIPIIVFINKLDREGKDAFDLLDEIEQKLKLKVCPLSFPIGMGYDFTGIYNTIDNKVSLIDGDNIKLINKDEIKENISTDLHNQFLENIELLEMVYPKFDRSQYLKSNIQPVFFGSALNNFGVEDLLRCFVKIAPIPQPKESSVRIVSPDEDTFTGFVFKIHANMDPKHRDRLAFIKIVSGEFKRNTPYLHVRLSKKLKFSSPNAFFADKKEIVDISYPGDIVGLHDTGNFKIGDTLTSGENLIYEGIPSFSPEHFRYINNADPMKSKQLSKGINQLMDEGVAQLFTLDLNGRKIIGTVGALQYEVIQYRLEHEYGAKCSYENLNVFKACWVECADRKGKEFLDFKRIKQRYLAKDKNNNLVFLADSVFSLNMTVEKYPSITFHNTSEF
jgi:peptide chain release factor 3